MESKTTRRFRELYKKLPENIKQSARDSYKLFRQNSRHPSLRFKKVHATLRIFSVRISLDYRAVGLVENDELLWFWIGAHKDYEKLLATL